MRGIAVPEGTAGLLQELTQPFVSACMVHPASTAGANREGACTSSTPSWFRSCAHTIHPRGKMQAQTSADRWLWATPARVWRASGSSSFASSCAIVVLFGRVRVGLK